MQFLVHITTVQNDTRRNIQAHGLALGNPAMSNSSPIKQMLWYLNL